MALHTSCKNSTSYLVCYYSHSGGGNHIQYILRAKFNETEVDQVLQELHFLPVMLTNNGLYVKTEEVSQYAAQNNKTISLITVTLVPLM